MSDNQPLVTGTEGKWQPWLAWFPIKCATTWPDRYPPRWTWRRGIERRWMTITFTYEIDADLNNHSHGYWEYRQPW